MKFRRKYLSIPYLLFLICFVIVPIVFIVYYAFTNKGGEFTFEKGESGHGVIVSTYKTENNSNKILTTDAVKFGGGMGNIQRNGIESKIPKYAEASRYWLQNSGFSPDVYHYTSSEKKGNDYKDDYFSKGLWVNALLNKYSVPISLAVGIHSDAGKFTNDSTVGTLAIYTRVSENKNT